TSFSRDWSSDVCSSDLRFVQQGRAGSGVGWDTIARIRDRWKKPLLVKGILHPADAERAAALGLDGAVVSNHGGRQFDAAPAPIRSEERRVGQEGSGRHV